MRLGIFGGTFDPIHQGHLMLAEQCREACRLDRVLFVPAGQPPHKSERQITAGKLRLEMVELAIAGHAAFAVSSVELEREGPSFSVDTLVEIIRQNPDAELFLLMGADSLAELPGWYQPARIASLATLVVAARPGCGRPDTEALAKVIGTEATRRLLDHVVEMPLVQISSSDIRARVANGQTIRYLVPRAVECFIETHGLYAGQGSRVEGREPEDKDPR